MVDGGGGSSCGKIEQKMFTLRGPLNLSTCLFIKWIKKILNQHQNLRTVETEAGAIQFDPSIDGDLLHHIHQSKMTVIRASDDNKWVDLRPSAIKVIA
jgi:hypothetical protein